MREFIDSNYYYGEIKFWANARKKTSVAVIVEAKSDELFFKKFFDKSTELFSVDGSDNVIKVLEKTEKNNLSFVIGIIDADFNRIINKQFPLINIFMTDGHDIEMMKINSDAWEEIITFHTEKGKLEKFENKHKGFLEYLFQLARQIANIRFLNYDKKLSLTFKSLHKNVYSFIDYLKFFDKDDLSFDETKMIGVIENKSQKQNFFKNNPDLKNELLEISQKEYNLYDFCNGHDLMNILALSLKKVINNKNISGHELEEHFTIAYRLIDFQKTELYSSLKNWVKKRANI